MSFSPIAPRCLASTSSERIIGNGIDCRAYSGGGGGFQRGRESWTWRSRTLSIPAPSWSYLTILLGDGTGKFTEVASRPPTGNVPTSIAVGDFNGDGKPDLAVANYCGNDPACRIGTVTILLGNGDGTFTATASSPSTGPAPYSIAVGDFNRDGNLDLAVAAASLRSNENGNVIILLGNGDGTFTAAASSPSTDIMPISVTVGDFNGDGNLDLAVANDDGVLTILLGDGTRQFHDRPADASALALDASVIRGRF